MAKKRFSIRNKLIIVFGLLIAVASLMEGTLAIRLARKAVIEKLEVQLIDKALDEAEIIDAKITALFQFLEGLSHIPILYDSTASYRDKIKQLQENALSNSTIQELNITDTEGTCYAEGGTVNVSDREWFKGAMRGEHVVSDLLISKTTQKQLKNWLALFRFRFTMRPIVLRVFYQPIFPAYGSGTISKTLPSAKAVIAIS